MRRVFAWALVVAVTAMAVWNVQTGRSWLAAIALAIVGVLLAAWTGRCRHRGPLALLPATTALDGTPLPARWFCADCSKTWAANFEKEHTPVKKFTGYDPSKAVNAAKRASELADRQRALSLQRAGLKPSTPKTAADVLRNEKWRQAK